MDKMVNAYMQVSDTIMVLDRADDPLTAWVVYTYDGSKPCSACYWRAPSAPGDHLT